jgi:hypothetical protein
MQRQLAYHIQVRLAAMEAFAAFFRSLSKKNQSKYYALLPEVLNILPPIKDSQGSEDLSKALVALIDLAETAPKMFKPLFHNLVIFSISVIQDKELDDLCRQNALELMATFADYAPSMCKKDSSYTTDMITQCLSLMTDLGEDDDDAAEWLSSDDVGPSLCQLHQNVGLTLFVAGSRGKRFEPCCWRAVHGPPGEQARRNGDPCPDLRLAAAHDAVHSLEG